MDETTTAKEIIRICKLAAKWHGNTPATEFTVQITVSHAYDNMPLFCAAVYKHDHDTAEQVAQTGFYTTKLGSLKELRERVVGRGGTRY